MKTKPSGYGMPVVCLRYYMEKVEVDHSLGLQSSGRKFPFGSRFACNYQTVKLENGFHGGNWVCAYSKQSCFWHSKIVYKVH